MKYDLCLSLTSEDDTVLLVVVDKAVVVLTVFTADGVTGAVSVVETMSSSARKQFEMLLCMAAAAEPVVTFVGESRFLS